MPPQFMDSPSEHRGFSWQVVPLFLIVAGAIVLLLAGGLGWILAIERMVTMPLQGQAFALLGISIGLLIAAVLKSIMIRRGNAVPNVLGYAVPWVMAFVGLVLLVLGILSL